MKLFWAARRGPTGNWALSADLRWMAAMSQEALLCLPESALAGSLSQPLQVGSPTVLRGMGIFTARPDTWPSVELLKPPTWVCPHYIRTYAPSNTDQRTTQAFAGYLCLACSLASGTRANRGLARSQPVLLWPHSVPACVWGETLSVLVKSHEAKLGRSIVQGVQGPSHKVQGD